MESKTDTPIITAYYASPIGHLRISTDGESVTGITFTEDTDMLPLRSMPPVLNECMEQLDDYFGGKRQDFDLPLKQAGTPFQQKAWQLLKAIPFGKTESYLGLAKRYGDPKAIRALASANGKNNIAIIIPCHRVIGSNATLIGYAGGLSRKKWLLEHEQKYSAGVQTLF